MVLTRACKMDSEKGKKIKVKIPNRNGKKNPGNEKSKMKPGSKSSSNCSNAESEEDDQNMPATVSKPVGLPGSSIRVTLKKTRSCSSTSSRESTQSFEVVRSVLPTTEESISEEEDCENPKASPEPEKTSIKSPSVNARENEKESESESQNANTSEDSDIEILSDDSQESFTERPSPAVSVKAENNIPINTVVELKTEEVPQSSMAIKKEFKVKVKSLKQEVFKDTELQDEIVELKDDDDDSDSTQVNQQQNGVAKKEIKEQMKEPVKEHKFKVNVRSFDDLAAPRTVNLITMPPPGPLSPSPNFLTQNGGSFPPPYLSCDVCGVQYDSPELLNNHKVTMKHFKCSFKECEHLVILSQQEFLDHQRMIHNIMPSPVQQLAHQVQRLPVGFDQQLQSGVPPLPENLPPGMYTQSLQMTNQQVPIPRNMRPMMRGSMQHNMMSTRGRNIQRGSMRGRSASLNMVPRGSSLKRPLNTPRRGGPPMKRTSMDRNAYPPNTMNKSPQLVKSLAETLTKSLSKPSSSSPASQQDVVSLFSKRGLTISTVDNGNNLSLPAGLSLNSAVSIIPTSPHKVPISVSNHESNSVSKRIPHTVTNQSLDTVDLTGPDQPKKYWPCEICQKTYTSIDKMYDHITSTHKSSSFSHHKCNLCTFTCPSVEGLNRHKLSSHKSETNNMPLVMPILDLSKLNNVARLKAMGITSYLPVAQLDNQGGQFGVPIMSTTNPGSLDGLKYTNFFNMGAVRKF